MYFDNPTIRSAIPNEVEARSFEEVAHKIWVVSRSAWAMVQRRVAAPHLHLYLPRHCHSTLAPAIAV